MGRIRAVLVGIDHYERSDIPMLHGCVNDVALVRDLLKGGFGLSNEDIRIVANGRATRKNILSRLEAMIAASEPGDVAVFYFSGHGSQIRDRNGDELSDGLDEIICPYDMDWDRETYIVDDDLDALFDTIPPDILLEAFFDCCFWGAGSRELVSPARPQALRGDVRYIPPPFDIAARAEGEEDRLEIHRLRECDCFAERNVMWAASREGQSAAEDYIDGRANGIFTYWGCRFIAENLPRLETEDYSREDLLRDVRGYLHELGYGQTPELSAPNELRAGAPLLGVPWGAWIERPSYP
jgi:metacaspase-1